MCVCCDAGQNEAIMETKYGDMGNSIREKHKARRGDFVLFADDDNWCATSPQRPYCTIG